MEKNRFALRHMAKVGAFLIVAAFACAVFTTPAICQGRLSLDIKAEKEIIKVVDGKEVTTRVPVDEVDVGDIIFFTIVYKNVGDEDIAEPTIVDPVPEGTVYILASAEGEDSEITFSIDGGNSYHKPPVMYLKVEPDGSKKETEASPDMYTHVRWVVGKALKPGKSGLLFLKVAVE
jgi:uncharacterized repeat protein (TIGR01451 family)